MSEQQQSGPREIPVKYANGNAPLITTTAKVIAFLITVITAFAIAYGTWLKSSFETTVDSRFDRFELRLTKEYALVKDTLPRAEYELRHKELIDRDQQMTDRINTIEKRLNDMNERIQNNVERRK